MIKYNYFILLILIFSMSCGKKTSGNIGIIDLSAAYEKEDNKEERDLFVPGTAVVLPEEDGTPTFRARYVSQDGKTLIGYETPAANEEDNPAVVLVHMKE